MKDERLRKFSTESAGKLARNLTGETPDLSEASRTAVAVNEWLEEGLRRGDVPLFANIDQGEGSAEITGPMFPPDELKSLWREYTDMTEDEMDQEIRKSGIYPTE